MSQSHGGEEKRIFSEYPDFFARFYDLIYHQVRDGVDNNFYLEKIKNSGGKVLEVGTGTGRLLIEALENGADIYGIDLSPAMLEKLRVKLDERHQSRITLQNIVDFRSDYRFDLIIAPFRVMMHLTEKSDQLKALENVYNHLKPGGEFVFDTFIPDLKMLISGINGLKDFESEFEPGNKISRTVTSKPDLINQLLDLTFLMEWNEGQKNFRKEWRSSMRYYFRFELEHLIERSLFEYYRITGDFEGNDLSNDSKEFIVTCIRKK
jgi:SAM-dependent methyltransferase